MQVPSPKKAMRLSTPPHKFIIDENVKAQLAKFLKSKGYDIKIAQKSIPDQNLAEISIKEKRILVTNDEDFIYYGADEVFSVVWLLVPQDDKEALLRSFDKLLNECKDFANKLVTLKLDDWQDFPLPMVIRV